MGTMGEAMETLLRFLPPNGEFRVCWIGSMKHFCIRIGDEPERVLCWTGTLTRRQQIEIFGDDQVPRFMDATVAPPEEPAPSPAADGKAAALLRAQTDSQAL